MIQTVQIPEKRPESDRHELPGKKTVQPKLIGKPGDRYEKEADAVADQVMRMPDATGGIRMQPSPSSPDIRMKCAECEKQERIQRRAGGEEALQMKPAVQPSTNEKQQASQDIGRKLSSTKGRGSPLPEALNAEMGSKIGADFSDVRIHTDTSAIQMNRELGAQAFTYGSDIYFNQGKYNPASSQGKHLLAHELTHTVQQKGGLKLQRELLSLGDACEDRGPAAREMDEDNPGSSLPPLIWNASGWLEKKRKKRPSVGYAQQLLNTFLANYDGENGAFSPHSPIMDQLRQTLPHRLKIDCWFGINTHKTTRLFQLVHQLEDDSKIGPATWPLLEFYNDHNPLPVCSIRSVPADTDIQLASFGMPGMPCHLPMLNTGPKIDSWSFKNSGKLSFDNCCPFCNKKIKLGVDSKYYNQFGTKSFVNGIETKAFIKNHITGTKYDMKRIIESSMWEGDGTSWKLFDRSGPGKDDDTNDQDECLTPQQIASDTLPYIYAMDHAGFISISPSLFDSSITDVVFKATFEEWVNIETPDGGAIQDGNVFEWHCIVWLNLVSGKAVFNKSKSKIDKGTIAVGTTGP